jgi:cation diffusion facilitator CzcD-associated flavoprotein CzcO
MGRVAVPQGKGPPMSAVQPSTDTARDVEVETCDVCIAGAGVAGLNALFVASQYLSRDQKVILVDRRERVGGMWVDTYPYVRLHQPASMTSNTSSPRRNWSIA